MDYQSFSDEQLTAEAQTGSQLAYTALVKRYWDRLVRYVRRMTAGSSEAEDVVQNALVKAWQNLRGFNPDRRFSPWIYRIVHNALVDHLKSRQRDPLPFFDPDVLFPHPVAPDRADTRADLALIRRQLDQSLDKLEAKYREVLVLQYYEALSYTEIADVLRLPVGTVGVRIKRALAKLQSFIPPHEHA